MKQDDRSGPLTQQVEELVNAPAETAVEMIRTAPQREHGPIVEALVGITESPHHDVERRTRAAYLLKELWPAQHWHRLEAIVNSHDSPCRVVAQVLDVMERVVFGDAGKKQLVPNLAATIHSRDERTKIRWIRLLGTVGNEWAVQELSLLADSASRSGEWALRTLAEVRIPAATLALQRHARRDAVHRDLAAELLEAWEDAEVLASALDALEQQLPASDALVRDLLADKRLAVICRLVAGGLVSEDGIREIAAMREPDNLSRSQRRFFRELAELVRLRLGDAISQPD